MAESEVDPALVLPPPQPPQVMAIATGPDGTEVITTEPPPPVDAATSTWGDRWVAHELVLRREQGLDVLAATKGVGVYGWIHRSRPMPRSGVAVTARVRLARRHCPFAYLWLGLCDAAGAEARTAPMPGQPSDLKRAVVTDGTWHDVRIEIGQPRDDGVPVSWHVDGELRCTRLSTPAGVASLALVVMSGVGEIQQVQQQPWFPDQSAVLAPAPALSF
jgi:hypothetical protein